MLKKSEDVKITAASHYLRYGLFGNALLFIIRILPYLERKDVFPQWSIGAELYGPDPDRIIIPGLFELSYAAPAVAARSVSLENLYKWHQSYLGSDFHALSKLWHRYFKTPERIEREADAAGDLSETLGVHYRGNEKLTSTWDSNYISQDDYLNVVEDILNRRSDIRSILITTDDTQFEKRVAAKFNLPLITRSAGRFLFEEKTSSDRELEADKALTDCILLSRCRAVISTSSALPSFAKIFQPDLEIYRCAASKLFEDSPYWPVAYIPVYKPENPTAVAIVNQAMIDDWTYAPQYKNFQKPFAYRRRSYLAHLTHRIQGRLGLLTVQKFMRKQGKK